MKLVVRVGWLIPELEEGPRAGWKGKAEKARGAGKGKRLSAYQRVAGALASARASQVPAAERVLSGCLVTASHSPPSMSTPKHLPPTVHVVRHVPTPTCSSHLRRGASRGAGRRHSTLKFRGVTGSFGRSSVNISTSSSSFCRVVVGGSWVGQGPDRGGGKAVGGAGPGPQHCRSRASEYGGRSPGTRRRGRCTPSLPPAPPYVPSPL